MSFYAYYFNSSDVIINNTVIAELGCSTKQMPEPAIGQYTESVPFTSRSHNLSS